MSISDYFSASRWFWRILTGRPARRIYLSLVLLLLIATAAVRTYSFVLTRRIQAVISGLSKLRINKTSEKEVLQTVPYLVRNQQDWQVEQTPEFGEVDRGVMRGYYVVISNEPSWMRFLNLAFRFSDVGSPKEGHQTGWMLSAADWLGYRYLGFSAAIIMFNGTVSNVRYGIADRLVFPRQVGEIVSVQSFHAFWAPHRSEFQVTSIDDESPEFRVRGDKHNLRVSYTSDAPRTFMAHAFQVDLSCFWKLRGCRRARLVSPLLWRDKESIEATTLSRLASSASCPDRILTGRVKYLPDIDVLLLESTGFKNTTVNEDGVHANENWTNYKLVETLRGRLSKFWPAKFWESVRGSTTIAYPGDYDRRLPNRSMQWTEAGGRVLAFSDLHFDSCQLVAATPSTMMAVRIVNPAPRRWEDMALSGGLQLNCQFWHVRGWPTLWFCYLKGWGFVIFLCDSRPTSHHPFTHILYTYLLI